MTNVITELLNASKRQTSQTKAIHILEVPNTAHEEWEDQLGAAKHPLTFLNGVERPVLVNTGKFGQILATLTENSLHYGGGATHAWAHADTSKRGAIIEVGNEGEGIDKSLAPNIPQKGVSSRGSTDIGLALAHDLTQTMGGRLGLKASEPPVFIMSVATIPASLNPDYVVPEGPLTSVGYRSRHF